MSLGHMSRGEKLVTLGGMFLLAPIGLFAGTELAGENGAALGVGLAFAVTMVLKAKMWRPPGVVDDNQRELGEFGSDPDE